MGDFEVFLEFDELIQILNGSRCELHVDFSSYQTEEELLAVDVANVSININWIHYIVQE